MSIKDRVGWALLQQALSCVLAHMRFMRFRKLSSFDGRWVGRHPIVLHVWHWDSVWATHETTQWGFHVEDNTRVWWVWLDSLIVIAKGGHSWCLRGSRVSCCQVDTLQGYIILIRISKTSSDMGEAFSLCLNIEVLYHHVHMRFMVRFNYDYLVVQNDDTKNGWLSYHACLA
jgi:hypothetical protein